MPSTCSSKSFGMAMPDAAFMATPEGDVVCDAAIVGLATVGRSSTVFRTARSAAAGAQDLRDVGTRVGTTPGPVQAPRCPAFRSGSPRVALAGGSSQASNPSGWIVLSGNRTWEVPGRGRTAWPRDHRATCLVARRDADTRGAASPGRAIRGPGSAVKRLACLSTPGPAAQSGAAHAGMRNPRRTSVGAGFRVDGGGVEPCAKAMQLSALRPLRTPAEMCGIQPQLPTSLPVSTSGWHQRCA
jgi:hypothetical protein